MVYSQRTACSVLLLLVQAVAKRDAHKPVQIGEFKFLSIVRLNDKFKCLGVLVSDKHVLTPCDCIGFYVDEYLYTYYFPLHMRVITGTVREKDGRGDDGDDQKRTPYVMRKHPQCVPYVFDAARMINTTVYDYGLITVAFPFDLDPVDYRVAPVPLADRDALKALVTDLIKTEGKCKTVSFPVRPTNSSWTIARMEWSHVQLLPTVQCEKELCSPGNSPSNVSKCVYDKFYFFGRFCATQRFSKATDGCFNNSGAPVVCGGTYVGHLGDTVACPKSRLGTFFMYSRFDWALPFVIQSSGEILKTSAAALLVSLTQI